MDGCTRGNSERSRLFADRHFYDGIILIFLFHHPLYVLACYLHESQIIFAKSYVVQHNLAKFNILRPFKDNTLLEFEIVEILIFDFKLENLFFVIIFQWDFPIQFIENESNSLTIWFVNAVPVKMKVYKFSILQSCIYDTILNKILEVTLTSFLKLSSINLETLSTFIWKFDL